MYKTNTTMRLLDSSTKIIKNDKLSGIHLNYNTTKHIIYLNKFFLTKLELESIYPNNKEIVKKLYDMFMHPIIFIENNDKIYLKTLTHSLKICNNLDKNFFISNIDLNNFYRDQYLDSNITVLDKSIFEEIITLSITDTKEILKKYHIYENYIPIIEKFLEYSIIQDNMNNK